MSISVSVSLLEEVMNAFLGSLSLRTPDFHNPNIAVIDDWIYVDGVSLTNLIFDEKNGVVTVFLWNGSTLERHIFTSNSWAFRPKEEVEAIAVRALALSCFK